MSKFRFKDFIFKNLLPYYYQENDTYIDDSGKGILERFMEVCSEYFDTDILDNKEGNPGLDNIVDLIDTESTPRLYLNYLWEFLGEIPYGYGVIVNGGKGIPNFSTPSLHLGVNPRLLLKYAISLYKIRGTEKFYEILGKYYGVKFQLIETRNGGYPEDEEEGEPNYDHLVIATYNDTVATYPLSSLNIRAAYPDGDCTSCLYFLLKIGIGKNLYNQLEEEGTLDNLVKILTNIVEKYLPIHCKIANYETGLPKIVTVLLGDFNSDFNNDFSNEGF